jgi:hypothetical protein
LVNADEIRISSPEASSVKEINPYLDVAFSTLILLPALNHFLSGDGKSSSLSAPSIKSLFLNVANNTAFTTFELPSPHAPLWRMDQYNQG